jgi:hypothetical protein
VAVPVSTYVVAESVAALLDLPLRKSSQLAAHPTSRRDLTYRDRERTKMVDKKGHDNEETHLLGHPPRASLRGGVTYIYCGFCCPFHNTPLYFFSRYSLAQ